MSAWSSRSGDAPIIKTVDGGVEKLVSALVREATKDAGAEVGS